MTPKHAVDLFWIPLGAGTGSSIVRRSGRVYEELAAHRSRRPVRAVFHTALQVHLDGTRHVIEMAPAWGQPPGDRGVVGHGPVGSEPLGRSRLFRYEIRRWTDGTIPDLADAVGGPQRLSSDEHRARRLLELVPSFPTATWGRDELRTGDMWNSNSLTSWLLARSAHAIDGLDPPSDGRASGWTAGLVVAARQESAAGRTVHP